MHTVGLAHEAFGQTGHILALAGHRHSMDVGLAGDGAYAQP
jgi:hypothetical protein